MTRRESGEAVFESALRMASVAEVRSAPVPRCHPGSRIGAAPGARGAHGAVHRRWRREPARRAADGAGCDDPVIEFYPPVSGLVQIRPSILEGALSR